MFHDFNKRMHSIVNTKYFSYHVHTLLSWMSVKLNKFYMQEKLLNFNNGVMSADEEWEYKRYTAVMSVLVQHVCTSCFDVAGSGMLG